MMRTGDGTLALLYFENKAVRPKISGFKPNARYRWTWYDPLDGQWGQQVQIQTDGTGAFTAPPFIGDAGTASRDWAAKVTAAP
jgi:hypothetical protein